MSPSAMNTKERFTMKKHVGESAVSTRFAALVIAVVATFVGLAFLPGVSAQEPLVITALNEKTVTELPAGPLFWRVETFPTLEAARAVEGPTALVAESAGQIWLVTLGLEGESSPGGASVTEIGPLPVVQATQYLLRINESSGVPGSVTKVHSHPGSEAFYVIEGEMSLLTPDGTSRVAAGQTETGPGGGTPLQVSSTGSTDLHGLVMFVVDAGQPFSSPAELPASAPHTPGMPSTGMGGTDQPTRPALVALLIGGGLLAGVAGSWVARRAWRRG
jgi:quercetin dioxygenase-like cupin family protein